MPYLLLVSGIVMLVSAVRGTYTDLIHLVTGEFQGSNASNNFMYWIAAILILGMVGYVKTLETFSRTMLALVIIALLLSNAGFFKTFFESIGADAGLGSNLGNITLANIVGTSNINVNVLTPSQESTILGGQGGTTILPSTLGL